MTISSLCKIRAFYFQIQVKSPVNSTSTSQVSRHYVASRQSIKVQLKCDLSRVVVTRVYNFQCDLSQVALTRVYNSVNLIYCLVTLKNFGLPCGATYVNMTLNFLSSVVLYVIYILIQLGDDILISISSKPISQFSNIWQIEPISIWDKQMDRAH